MRELRGNILFLILLAVVLFAALSYAVTSSMRGGGRDISAEQAQTLAASLIQKGDMYATAIQRLMLVNDCKDTQISFQNDVESGYTNNNAPTTPKKCHVFHPDGGGMSWENPDPKALAEPPAGLGVLWLQNAGRWIFTGDVMIVGAGTTGTTNTNTDLVLYLPYITKEVCLAVNRSLGIPDSSTVLESIMNLEGAHNDKFAGVYYAYAGNGIGDQGFPPDRHYGCLQRSDTSHRHYAYFHLLLAR